MKRWALAACFLVLAASGCSFGTPKSAPSPAPSSSSSVSSTGTAAQKSQSPGGVTVQTATVKPLKGVLPNMALTDASFSSNQQGWVTGAYGKVQNVSSTSYAGSFVAKTTNGGTAWSIVARMPGKVLSRIHFVSTRDGFAVGGTLPKAGSQSASAYGDQNTLYGTTDGGSSWSALWTVKGTITSMTFPASGGLSLSVSGPCTAKACQGGVFTSQDGGAHFTKVLQSQGPVIALASGQGRMWAAEVAPKAKKGVTVKVQSTQDGGKHWDSGGVLPTGPELQSYFTTASRFTSSMGFSSAKDGLLTLFSGDSCAMHGCSVADTYRTTNGGRSWQQVKNVAVGCGFAPTLAVAKSAVALAQGVNLGACPGPEDTLFATGGAGGTFKVAGHFQQLGISAMGFLPSGRLWALGQKALVISANKVPGAASPTWTQVFPAVVPTGLIHFVSASTGYAAGDAMDPGAILKTTDGGRTWQVLASLAGLQATSLSFVGGGTGYAGAVPELAESRQPAVLKTTDGGRTWTVAYRPGSSFTFFPHVHFFSAQKGLLLNLNVNCTNGCEALTMTSSDSGRQWAQVASPKSPGDVSSASVLTPTELRVGIMSTRSHPAGLDASSDGGKTWHSLASFPKYVDGSMNLDFVSPQVGLVAAERVVRQGGNGKIQIAHAAVLKTSDGGKSFTLYDLSALTGDWSSSVSFISPTHGWLRTGESLWETTDGGSVWQQVR